MYGFETEPWTEHHYHCLSDIYNVKRNKKGHIKRDNYGDEFEDH